MSNINNMLFLVASERNAPCLNWSSEACFFRFSYIGAICHIMYFHVYILQTTCHWRGAQCHCQCHVQSQGSVGSKSCLKISNYLRTFPVFASSTANLLFLYLCALPFYFVFYHLQVMAQVNEGFSVMPLSCGCFWVVTQKLNINYALFLGVCFSFCCCYWIVSLYLTQAGHISDTLMSSSQGWELQVCSVISGLV